MAATNSSVLSTWGPVRLGDWVFRSVIEAASRDLVGSIARFSVHWRSPIAEMVRARLETGHPNPAGKGQDAHFHGQYMPIL
jgi:hypothetical protein